MHVVVQPSVTASHTQQLTLHGRGNPRMKGGIYRLLVTYIFAEFLGTNVGALIIRIGSWGILNYIYNKEPQNGNYRQF